MITKQQFTTEDRRAYKKSDDDSLQICKTGKIVISTTSNISAGRFGTFTIPHNLGVIPAFMCFYKHSNANSYKPIPDIYMSFSVTGYRGGYCVRARATSSNLIIEFIQQPGTVPVFNVPFDLPIEVKYYIFKQTINE